MKNKALSIAVFYLLILSIGKAQVPSDFIHTDGKYLIHGNNNDTIYLRGINFNNFWLDDGSGNWIINDPNDSGVSQPYAFGDQNWFIDASQMGFNTVRVTMNYRLFEDNTSPYVYKQSGWDFINQYITWAQQYNMYLILDMHVPPGGLQNTTGAQLFWMNQAYQDRVVALWNEIAVRYVNDTTIAGFDLLNEPTPVDSIAAWSNLAQRIADTIRTVDNNHLLTVEYAYGIIDTANVWYPFWDLSQQMFFINDNNVMYDFHYYNDLQYTLQCYNSPGCTPSIQYNDPSVTFATESGNTLPFSQPWLVDDLADWMTIYSGANVPINIGEWAPWRANYEYNNNQMQGYEYICDLMALFEQMQLNWQYYCYSEFRNTTQDINGNDGLNTRLFNQMNYGNCSGSTSIEEVSKNKFLVYPNPFSEQIKIVFNTNYDINNIQLFNISGKLVSNFPPTEKTIKIDVVPGVYFLKITETNGKVEVIQLIKE